MVRPVGFAVIVSVAVELAALGDTDSHPPVELAENETGAFEPENVTCCVRLVVEPKGAEGLHELGEGDTLGGAAPVATSVAPARLNVVGFGSVVVV